VERKEWGRKANERARVRYEKGIEKGMGKEGDGEGQPPREILTEPYLREC